MMYNIGPCWELLGLNIEIIIKIEKLPQKIKNNLSRNK